LAAARSAVELAEAAHRTLQTEVRRPKSRSSTEAAKSRHHPTGRASAPPAYAIIRQGRGALPTVEPRRASRFRRGPPSRRLAKRRALRRTARRARNGRTAPPGPSAPLADVESSAAGETGPGAARAPNTACDRSRSSLPTTPSSRAAPTSVTRSTNATRSSLRRARRSKRTRRAKSPTRPEPRPVCRKARGALHRPVLARGDLLAWREAVGGSAAPWPAGASLRAPRSKGLACTSTAIRRTSESARRFDAEPRPRHSRDHCARTRVISRL
jgi:hypothetical protein